MNYKETILRAISAKSRPPSIHKVFGVLLYGYFNNLKWKEYRVIKHNDSYVIVNYLCTKLKWAIIIHKDTTTTFHTSEFVITQISENEIKSNSKSLEYLLLSEHMRLETGDETYFSDQSYSHPRLASERIDGPESIRLNKGAFNVSYERNISGDEKYDTISTQEEVNELIGNAPSWMLRSGITMVALVLAILLSLSYFIKYPDKIKAKGFITTEQPPTQLLAPRSGRIDSIIVMEGEKVEIGDFLIYFGNTSKLDDVIEMLDWIKLYKSNRSMVKFPTDLTLGQLQPLYAQLQLVYNEFRQTCLQTSTLSQLATLNQEIQNIGRLNNSIKAEQELYSKEKDLANKELTRASMLYSQGLISLQDYETIETRFNSLLRQAQSTTKSIIRNEIRRDQLILDAKKLKEQRETALVQFEYKIEELILQFTFAYDVWIEENFITAEVAGIVEYEQKVVQHYSVQLSQSMGYIIPEFENNHKYVHALLEPRGLSKIDKTSKIIIKFDGYPYKEYGILVTTNNELAKIPVVDKKTGDSYYDITVELPDTLKTNYGRIIDYRPEMGISAELITKDRSILERMLESIISLLRN